MYTLEMKRFIKRRGVVWLTVETNADSTLSSASVLSGYDAINYQRMVRGYIAGDYTSETLTELEKLAEAGTLIGASPDEHAVSLAFSELKWRFEPVLGSWDAPPGEYFSARKAYVERLAWDGEAALKLDASATEPFRYEYGIGDSNAEVYVCICQTIIALACAGAASTAFAQGYAAGADGIIRCTKHGKARFARTKILAAISYSALMYLICCGLFSAIVLISFGPDSSAAQFKGVYMMANKIDYHLVLGGITSNGFYALCVLSGFLAAIALTCFALWVSAASQNAQLSLAASAVMVLLPYVLLPFYPRLGDQSAYLQSLLPGGGICAITGMWKQLANGWFLITGLFSIWTPFVMLAAPVIEAPVFALLARRAYVRHECA